MTNIKLAATLLAATTFVAEANEAPIPDIEMLTIVDTSDAIPCGIEFCDPFIMTHTDPAKDQFWNPFSPRENAVFQLKKEGNEAPTTSDINTRVKELTTYKPSAGENFSSISECLIEAAKDLEPLKEKFPNSFVICLELNGKEGDHIDNAKTSYVADVGTDGVTHYFTKDLKIGDGPQ